MTTGTSAAFVKATTPAASIIDYSLRNKELFENRCKGGFIKKTLTLRSYDIRRPFQRLYWVDARFLYDIGQIAPRALSESTDLPPIFSAVDTIVTEAIKEVTDFQGKLAKKQAACKDFGRAEYDNPLIEEVRIISQPCGDLVKLYETIDGLVADNDGLLYCGGCSAPDHDDALKALLKILSRFHAHLAGAHQKFTQLLMAARMAGQAPRDDEHAAEKPVKLSAVGASSAP